MARDCTERFQSVEEMSKEVLSWLEGAQRRDKALVTYQYLYRLSQPIQTTSQNGHVVAWK